MFRDLESGQNIRIAKNLVYQTCCGYLAFPLTVVISIICSLIGWDNVVFWKDGIISIVGVLIVAVLIGIGVSKLARPLNDSRVYLSYFKRFKRKDEEWLKKWGIYTVLLYLGGIASAAIGMGILFYSVMHT